ncbi:MAG TPA: ABC transporter ATP-binding protein, partial [Rhodothermales bacterium]
MSDNVRSGEPDGGRGHPDVVAAPGVATVAGVRDERSHKISLTHVSKTYGSGPGSVRAVDDVNLEVRVGEFICIVGPSGCGKTTVLRMIADLEPLSEGQIAIAHHDPARALTTVIFQEDSILPWMSVRKNVSFGPRMRGVPKSAYRGLVEELIAKVGLTKFADALPHQLSGGMKQRVSIARAFANDPEILLMDEPFAALDEQNRLILQEELLRIWGETRKTVVFITHSIDEAVFLSDRVVVMSSRPGRIMADIQVPFSRPRTLHELRVHPEFGALTGCIWRLLRDEVRAA